MVRSEFAFTPVNSQFIQIQLQYSTQVTENYASIINITFIAQRKSLCLRKELRNNRKDIGLEPYPFNKTILKFFIMNMAEYRPLGECQLI